MGGARPAGRAVPAGDQGTARPGAGALQARRLSRDLARCRRLLRRVAAPAPGSPGGTRVRPSRVRHGDADRAGALDDLVIASVYVPNGGKDFAAKLRFLQGLVDWTRALRDQGRKVIVCGDINIARTDIDVHPKERKAGVIGQRDEERALFEAMLGDGLIDVARALDPDNDRLFTLVAAVARHAQAQHRLAHRLHPRVARDRGACHRVQGAGRRRHQRSAARTARDARRCRRPLSRSARTPAASGTRRTCRC